MLYNFLYIYLDFNFFYFKIKVKGRSGIMPVTNISNFRKNLFSTIEGVVEFNEPVTINSKKGNAVLISEEEFNSMIETIYLTSQPGLVEKIKEGENENIEEMKKFDPDEEW